MPEDSNAQAANKPNPVTQELLAQLGKPTQPPASAAGCAVASAGAANCWLGTSV
jgi:hypothetical protein